MSAETDADDLMAPPPPSDAVMAPPPPSDALMAPPAAAPSDQLLAPPSTSGDSTSMSMAPPAGRRSREARIARRREAEAEKRRLEQEEAEARQIDFESIHESFDLSGSVDWDRIVKICATDDGSNGVFFLQTHLNTIFVLKGSSFVAEELFASRLASRIQPRRIHVPQTRLIEFHPRYGHHNDWVESKGAMFRFGEKDEVLMRKFKKNLTRGFYLLMEFVWGVNLPKVREVLGPEQLREIGRIFCFDVVVNNYDRIPCPDLFEHEGNPDNVMILKGRASGSVCAIDTVVNPLRSEEALEHYYAGVEKLVRVHCSSKWGEGNVYIDTIAGFLFSSTGNRVDGEPQRRAVWEGMEEFLAVNVASLSQEVLREERERVRKMKTGDDWADVYRDSMKRIDLEFLSRVIDTMRRIHQE